MTRVLFNAKLPGGSTHRTDFVHGKGPCGKTVCFLIWKADDIFYTLTQFHTDGTRKVFTFRKEDIVGRLVVERGPVDVLKGSKVDDYLRIERKARFARFA